MTSISIFQPYCGVQFNLTYLNLTLQTNHLTFYLEGVEPE